MYLDLVGGPYTFVLMDVRGNYCQAKLIDLQCWVHGKHMPSFLDDFDRWWLATLLKRDLCKCYAVKIEDMHPEHMPITQVNWEERYMGRHYMIPSIDWSSQT